MDLTKTMQELNKASSESAVHQQENKTLKLQVQHLQDQLDQYQKNLSTVQSELGGTQKALKVQLLGAEDELRKERIKVTSLSKELNTTQSASSIVTTECKDLTSRLATSEAKRSMLEESLASAVMHGDEAMEKERALQKEKEEEKRRRVEFMEKQLETQKHELHSARQQANEHGTSVKSQEQRLLEITKLLQEKEEALVRSEQGRVNSVKIQTKLRQELAACQHELALSCTSREKLCVEVEQYKCTGETREKEIEEVLLRMKDELRTAANRAEQAEEHSTQVTNELNNIKVLLSKAQTSSSNQSVATSELEHRCLLLETELDAVQKKHTASECTISSMRQELVQAQNTLESERAKSSSQFTTLSEECRTAVTAREISSRKAQSLQEKNEELATAIQQADEVRQNREEMLLLRESELRSSVAKLSKALDACEGEITCMHCLGLFKEPATVVSTGETYCGMCYESGKIEGVTLADETVSVKRLETMSGKFGFMKQALDQVRLMCK